MEAFWVPRDTVVSLGWEEAPALAMTLSSPDVQAMLLTFSEVWDFCL